MGVEPFLGHGFKLGRFGLKQHGFACRLPSSFRRKSLGAAIQPHVIPCGMIADPVFLGRLIPADLSVVDPAANAQPLP